MKETYIQEKVTYTIRIQEKLFVVENVPARVCKETGEQFFSPETVEHLQQIIMEEHQPVRTIETPVYEY
jgi:YgiT-type zinc finger domain-containing protein